MRTEFTARTPSTGKPITASSRKALSCLLFLTLLLCGTNRALAADPAFRQEKDSQATSGNTSRVTFSSSIVAGNLIAVYLIWDNTGSASVSDSMGNSYASGVAPIRWSNGRYSAQIFYTMSSSSGNNSVTATFATKLSQFGIIYAHEYSGIRVAAPIDVTASAAGTSGSLSSGSSTTTNDNDLLFAGGVSANYVSSPGTAYTARSTAQGNITEDRIVSVKGSYSATASNSGGAWAMQMVAFKGLATGDTTPPTVPAGLTPTVLSSSQINLSWNASTDPDNSPGQLTYAIYRNGVRVATTGAGGTSWTDSGLSPASTYSYTACALDPAGNTSPQSTVVQATTPPLNDTTPPTVPGNLGVTGTTASTVSLIWSASTDNVGVAGYRVYRGGAQVGTVGTTSYTDTGLPASTTYSYTVSAFDASGNNSAQSTPVSATTATPDTQPPSVSITSPANNQTVSGVTSVTANATDNVGVVGVQFQTDGGNLGAEVTSPPYSVSWATNQASNGGHVLTAIARDAAGNRSTSSTIAVNVNNTQVRPYSTNFPLTETTISEGGNWMSAVAGTNGNLWGNVATSSHFAYGPGLPDQYGDPTAMLTGSWNPDQSAQATVRVVSPRSDCCHEVEIRLRVAMGPNSITGYEINCSVSTSPTNYYLQAVRWNGPNANFTYIGSAKTNCVDGDVLKAGMTGSKLSVYKNGTLLFTVNDSTFTSGAPGIGFYQAGNGNFNDFGFSAFTASDASNNDTTPPTVPGNLSATVISPSEIDLSWSASTDNVGVTGYQVFRNNAQIGTAAGTGFSDRAVAPGVPYTYTVDAFDSAGNVSAQSSPVTAQTSSDPDITPPSIPNNLASSNVTATSVKVAWSASTDNVAVAGYVVFRNNVQVATTTTTSYTDAGLTPSTTYTYTVEAFDTSNNLSAPSQPLTVTTNAPTAVPPSVVQTNQNQISSGASTSVTFNTPTVAGNTLVVYVIWNNTGNIVLTDSQGNTFASVSAPVNWNNGNSAQIFYAAAITGGPDTVTAAFRTPVTKFGVVYAHEYAGISAINPVDVTALASGSSASMNSGSASTTSPNDLIFGAGVSDNSVTVVGSGFTARDLAYGNVTEDLVAGTIGPYAATATHNGNTWGMQVVAFRAAQ